MPEKQNLDKCWLHNIYLQQKDREYENRDGQDHQQTQSHSGVHGERVHGEEESIRQVKLKIKVMKRKVIL